MQKTKKRNNEEHQYQSCIVEYIDLKYPDVPYYAIPNGELRNLIVAKRLKKEGAKAGVPDLCICRAKQGYHGFYIEMKAEKGKVSNKQKEWINKLESENYKVSICYSVDDAIKEIDSYLK